MPAVFQQLQELDDKRIKQMENYLRKGVDIERSVYPIINKCLDGIIRAADSINPEQVCRHTHRTSDAGFWNASKGIRHPNFEFGVSTF
jgi:hypothetical protein